MKEIKRVPVFLKQSVVVVCCMYMFQVESWCPPLPDRSFVSIKSSLPPPIMVLSCFLKAAFT